MPIYAIGTPIFDKVTINLENGEQFVIESNGVSTENYYIQSANLNGDNLKTSFIRHDDIVRGGNLTFEMSNQPNMDWFDSHPSSAIADNLITPVPYFEAESRTFTDKMEVKMGSVDPNSKIYYQTNGGEPQEYTAPFVLEASAKFVAYAEKDGKKSFETTAEFFKIDGSRSIELHAEYANQYAAGGDKALIDYMRGRRQLPYWFLAGLLGAGSQGHSGFRRSQVIQHAWNRFSPGHQIMDLLSKASGI